MLLFITIATLVLECSLIGFLTVKKTYVVHMSFYYKLGYSQIGIQRKSNWARKMAQWLSELAALPQDLRWVPSNYWSGMGVQTACNSNSRGMQHPLLASRGTACT